MTRTIAVTGALGVALMLGGVAHAANDPLAQAQPQSQTAGQRNADQRSTPNTGAGMSTASTAVLQNATGTVAEIDKDRRMITLELASGQKLKLQADPSVTNLDDINKGDRVAVDYEQNSALGVRKTS